MKLCNRTICLKITKVVEGGTKSEFYTDLRKSLDLSRRAANKSVTECVRQDSGLMVGGKCPKLYTYPIVKQEFQGVTNQCSSICRAVESKYKQERWHVARGQKSICNYRSMPWPLLSNKSIKTIKIEDNGEYLTAKIKLLSGWWTVQLASGSNYKKQNNGVRNAIKIGDSKIWTDRKHQAVIGVSVQQEAKSDSKRSGTLTVSSSIESIIVATKQKNDTPFVITGDEVKQWSAERERRYKRLGQDRKSGTKRQALNSVYGRVSNKWNQRIDSFTHQTAAAVVNHAKRRKVNKLVLDFTIKSWSKKFAWFELAEKIKYKCEDAGIEFVEATQRVAQPDVEKPHVYFKLDPSSGRVKIGQTSVNGGKRHKNNTDASVELLILAVDNQPKSKVKSREKHWHAYFADHRLKGEWFDGDPIINWLREAGWFGNAGNLSQIAQVIDT